MVFGCIGLIYYLKVQKRNLACLLYLSQNWSRFFNEQILFFLKWMFSEKKF